MTLPFRRRHHDHEASHDRARAIAESEFLGITTPADAAWLEQHRSTCAECTAELDAFRADRELLRSLRDTTVDPPRDLWARTAAAIERDGSHRERRGRAAYGGPRIGRVPIGVLSGVLVIMVVVGTSLMGRPGEVPVIGQPSGTPITGLASPPPEATPLAVTAQALSWVQEQSDGSFDLVVASLDKVCTDAPDACAPLDSDSSTHIRLTSEPESVVVSPDNAQLVVVPGSSGAPTGDVLVLDVPTAGPTGGPTDSPSPSPTTPPTTAPTPTLDPGVTPDPNATPVPTDVAPSPTPDPAAGRAIVTGVIVVGETTYSQDGQWLAFSARPIDGSAGPDLYLWKVGDEQAVAMTADHETYFAGWLGNQILASRVELPAAPGTPDASADPSASPGPTAKPGKSPNPGGGKPSPVPTLDPSASPEATAPIEGHPVSFLLDPLTGITVTIDGLDVWRPVVDLETQVVVYWSGTLLRDAAGTGWVPATGSLVLDGWITPEVPLASAAPGESGGPVPPANPTAGPGSPAGSLDPLPSPEPTQRPGPAGDPQLLVEGPVGGFDVQFDPDGTRLAVWIPDPENGNVGTLRLILIDAATGRIDTTVDPLPGVAAKRGYSIGAGRLAWVTPPGQDGESSHVHVLAWKGDEFGQVRSLAAERLFVVR